MATSAVDYVASDLDGQDPGGFVVVNVDARTRFPYQVLEDEVHGSAYYRTLREARRACKQFRRCGDNDEIYVYALVGVPDALRSHSDSFLLE
jgi:hypothetical protein